MGSTGTRTLRLLSLLQTSRYWSGAELADRLGISLRTLRRDVERLREIGYPVEAQRGVEGGYQLAAGAALPPLVLDDDEAVALALGLQAAALTAVDGMAESSVRALAKVVQVMPRRLRRRVEALQQATMSAGPASSSFWPSDAPTVDTGVLTALAQSCRDEETCRFTYLSATGQRSDRTVEPHRLVTLGRRWYLVAYDLDRQDWRSFRLDRTQTVLSAGRRFAPRRLPAEDAAAFLRASVAYVPAPHAVVAEIRAPADDVTAKIGRWATVTALDATTCRVEIGASSPEWAIIALGVTGADFTVVSPAALADQVRQWGERFVRASPDPGA